MPTADCTPAKFCEANALGIPHNCIAGGVTAIVQNEVNGYYLTLFISSWLCRIETLLIDRQKAKVYGFNGETKYEKINWVWARNEKHADVNKQVSVKDFPKFWFILK